MLRPLKYQSLISHQTKLINMKSVIFVTLALVAVAVALPVDKPEVEVVHSENNVEANGSYNFGYALTDGNTREETGEVKEVLNEENKPQNVVVVRGSYEYTNPEGNHETITYFADETGFHAEGPSIPKPASR